MRIVILALGLALTSTAVNAAAHAKRKPTSPSRTIDVIPATGTLNASNLVAIGRLFVKKGDDQFTDDPTVAYIGREFTIEFPPAYISTNYERATQTLTAQSPQYGDGVVLREEETASQFVGRNGFGTKAVVTKRRGNHFGIWLPGQSYSRKPITYTVTLAGEDARSLSKALRLRVSGKITKADGVYAEKDSAVYKKSIISDATVSEPYDTWISQILLSVTFTKAQWIDSRTGAVISEAVILTP